MAALIVTVAVAAEPTAAVVPGDESAKFEIVSGIAADADSPYVASP